MKELDRIPVKGQTFDAQNGRLATFIGDKPWKIEMIKREPSKKKEGETESEDSEDWVVYGER